MHWGSLTCGRAWRTIRRQAGMPALRATKRPVQSAGQEACGTLRADQLEGFQDHRIALGFHFVAFFHAEGLVEELGLKAVGNKVTLGEPLGDAWPDLAV